MSPALTRMLKPLPRLIFVSVVLISFSRAADGQIRLARSGSTQWSGRVEIYHNNTWGTVCDDNWDLNDAKVVCRQLGCGTSLSAPGSAHFGQGTGQIWLDDVSCSGSEKSLTECQHRGFGTHNCGHGEDAGVTCSDCVRLAGSGSNQCSGRVEIYHDNTWGTVCDDNWDLNDAKVVCRQLGCGPSLSAPQSAYFGQGTGQIWLDDVSCSGSEKSLTECQHRGFGTHDCGHGEDAGVTCSVDLPKPSISRNPAGEVSWGGNVGITCSISTRVLGGTFILKKTSGSFRKTQSSSTNAATFNIPNVNFDNEGSYQCQYEKSISSRSYSSPLSDSVRLSVTVSLPKPSISMNPTSEVAWGENVGITCSISTQHLGGTFILKKTSGSFRRTKSSSTNSATFNIPNVNFDNEGSYQCQYEKSFSSRSFSSPLSDSIRLSVTVILPKPSISMNPAGEVAWGDKVGITCSVSTQHLGGTFILKKTSSSFRRTKSSSTNSATFNIPNVNFDNEGSYQCQYEKNISSRSFSSPLSDSVRLSVTVPLQQPSIYLTSRNGGLVWGPEGAAVTRGDNFVLTCSINSSYPGGCFSLIFSGSNITNTEPAVNLSASFNFPVAEYEHEGNYSCVYEVTLSGRKFAFTMTSVMNVTIKFPLLLTVSSASTGALLLLLLLLLVVCLVSWRRRRAKQPRALSLSPVAISNKYQITDEDENEEEQHYMNFQPLHSEKRQEEQAREMEMEEDETGNVYDVEEDNDRHYSVEREDVYDIVDANEEEYDICVFNKAAKNNNDTDDDHQHIPSAEDTLDIYGEQENIYQNY